MVGPLIDEAAFDAMAARSASRDRARSRRFAGGFYVRPALVEVEAQEGTVLQETFAPILYVLRYRDLDEAIALNNARAAGPVVVDLHQRPARGRALPRPPPGSDCGIANVNIGPSGAEIGGAFGGEKETGGGRESGSDSWRAYMRRATNTVNYGDGPAAGAGDQVRRLPHRSRPRSAMQLAASVQRSNCSFHGSELLGLERLGDEIALARRRSRGRAAARSWLDRLDPFGGGGQAEPMGEIDDRLDDQPEIARAVDASSTKKRSILTSVNGSWRSCISDE